MSKRTTVFFTGMDASDAEQLAKLFQDVSRRSGNHWTLAADADSAQVVVIDVDTLYGHMTWLRSHNSNQTVVALTTGDAADTDHVLQRPVSPDAMHRLLMNLGDAAVAARPAPATATATATAATTTTTTTTATTAAAETPATARTVTTPTPAQVAAVAPASAAGTTPAAETTPPAPLAPPSPASEPAATPTAPKLIDLLLAGEAGNGPCRLDVPGQAPLLFDVAQKVFLGGNSIKAFLPHTQAKLSADAIQPVTAAEFEAQRANLGSQPLARLLWLAALGSSNGSIPGSAADSRYRLGKWPQIEREFPKHFRIATTMMKGFQSPAEITELSGAELSEVNDFITASLVSGHAEIEGSSAAGALPAPAQKGLLERLRGAR